MIIITNYQLLSDEEENLICVSRESTAVCPIRGALLCPRDSRNRIMKNYGGTCTYIRIRRMKCHACGKLHHELPYILVDYSGVLWLFRKSVFYNYVRSKCQCLSAISDLSKVKNVKLRKNSVVAEYTQECKNRQRLIIESVKNTTNEAN